MGESIFDLFTEKLKLALLGLIDNCEKCDNVQLIKIRNRQTGTDSYSILSNG